MTTISIAFVNDSDLYQFSTYHQSMDSQSKTLVRLLACAPSDSEAVLLIDSFGFEGFDLSCYESADSSVRSLGELDRQTTSLWWEVINFYWFDMIRDLLGQGAIPCGLSKEAADFRLRVRGNANFELTMSIEEAREIVVRVDQKVRWPFFEKYNDPESAQMMRHPVSQLDDLISSARGRTTLKLYVKPPSLVATIARLGYLALRRSMMRCVAYGFKDTAVSCSRLAQIADSLNSFLRAKDLASSLKSFPKNAMWRAEFYGVQMAAAHRVNILQCLREKDVPYTVKVPADAQSSAPIRPFWELDPSEQERVALASLMAALLDSSEHGNRAYHLSLDDLRAWYEVIFEPEIPPKATGFQEQFQHCIAAARIWWLSKHRLPFCHLWQT